MSIKLKVFRDKTYTIELSSSMVRVMAVLCYGCCALDGFYRQFDFAYSEGIEDGGEASGYKCHIQG